jgi:hypothetical protein
MQNPLVALIRKAREIRRERHLEAELDLRLEDAGFRPINLTHDDSDLRDDDLDWDPSDEKGPLW